MYVYTYTCVLRTRQTPCRGDGQRGEAVVGEAVNVKGPPKQQLLQLLLLLLLGRSGFAEETEDRGDAGGIPAQHGEMQRRQTPAEMREKNIAMEEKLVNSPIILCL